MQQLKFKETSAYARSTWWECPFCHKEMNFQTTVPIRCPNKECDAKLPNVHLLAPHRNQDNRVKYFMSGKM
jgi:hypothetical protein